MKKMDLEILNLLQLGTVIPAHPLALTPALGIDEQYQRLLTRYYIKSGAGGVAIGVHTTQFAIRDTKFGLLEPVLKIAADEIKQASLQRPFIKVAGICGNTPQALHEAELANKYQFHLGLLSFGGLNDLNENALIQHAKAVARKIPLIGFYLQPSVGGRKLTYKFWREFVEIPSVYAIKVAAFNRYQTIDVVRAVCESSRADEIALYTGNDDNIIADLLTPYRFQTVNGMREKRFVGGLLGHWAVWTHTACLLLKKIKECIAAGYNGVEDLLALNVQVTDMNAAIFDSAHGFEGCVPGIHEVLFRQGLLRNTRCLDPDEILSVGQAEEINRVNSWYKSIPDDAFVNEFLRANEQFLDKRN